MPAASDLVKFYLKLQVTAHILRQNSTSVELIRSYSDFGLF
jgi:hypothetical protein